MLDKLPHIGLSRWIREMAELTQPSRVHICDGSPEEYQTLCDEMIRKKMLIPLNPQKRPHSFLARSHPKDVARVEASTFICSMQEEDAGPTNHWRAPDQMLQHLRKLFTGCMRGRTLYVIPYSMGPLYSDFSHIGVEITDSPYVVCSMRTMARIGKEVIGFLQERGIFIPCMHSVGKPLHAGAEEERWPCNPSHTVIAHFPEQRSIWSFGSGYGGNALLGKKCFALRIASIIARETGCLAEHMLIIGIRNPAGKKKYFAAAFPSACGKTNLAMLRSQLPGWEITCVGDDIAWMKFDTTGRLRAINPETGFFGVAPGTSPHTNPYALSTCAQNTIFTNVALTADQDIWWEGLTATPPENLTDWLGERWTPASGHPAAHPNSRFTAPIRQCPILDPAWDDPEGVPIEAIIFGGRRSHDLPLVYEAFDWEHGVFLGATLSSETTAAAEGAVGTLRYDPFAMLPFCGYNMADYFQHWLRIGKRAEPLKLPRLFRVNWFRKDEKGSFLWPGFGENMRVLKWIFERCEGKDHAEASPIGLIPKQGALDLTGSAVSADKLSALFAIDPNTSLQEMQEIRHYLSRFGDRLPKEIVRQIDKQQERIHVSIHGG